MPQDKEIILFTVVGTFITLFLSITLFIFFISYQKRKFKYIKERQQLQTDFQQELLKAQLEIQEQTFRNISDQIHDNIQQMLTLVKLNLNTTDVTNAPETSEKVKRSKELVATAINDLRDLSKSLNPEIIKNVGLSEAVQRELLVVAKAGQYEVNLSQHGDFFRFDPEKELIVFRIFQEVLNNIIKHSQAKTVNVKLEYQPYYFSLLVSDDGSGFDATKLESEDCPRSLGVRNMHSRALMIGARVQLTSTINKGTAVFLELGSGENENGKPSQL